MTQTPPSAPTASETSAGATARPGSGVRRRGFFSTFGLGGAAAVAAAAATMVTDSAPAEAVTPPSGKGGAHYRESEHVKQYYRVNRY